MAAQDHQLGLVEESTYGTPVVVTKFFEYNSESIESNEGRTEGDPLRAGTMVIRNDRFTPYYAGASGSIELDVMNKGFGYLLKHMVGTVATTGVGPYVHTGTFGELLGDMLTVQLNRPFHPTGTNQAFTYSGGKVTNWTLSNAVDGNLVCELGMDFQVESSAIALATASYPASMDNLTWAGGVLSVGGSNVDITEFSLSCDNGMDVDRRFIRANTLKKEPTTGRRSVEFSVSADFENITQRDRAHASTKAAALAQIIGTWTSGPDILTVTIPACRFDKWAAPASDADGIKQTLSGVGRFNGTNSPITLAYTTSDVTP